jgi:hypothetical protein
MGKLVEVRQPLLGIQNYQFKIKGNLMVLNPVK